MVDEIHTYAAFGLAPFLCLCSKNILHFYFQMTTACTRGKPQKLHKTDTVGVCEEKQAE